MRNFAQLMAVLCLVAATCSANQPADPPTISGPRELLRLFGIDDSQMRHLVDGRPLGPEETETLLKVMYRIRDFRQTDLHRWARSQTELIELMADEQVVKDSSDHRGEIFSLAGRVTSVEVRRPVPEAAERLQLPQYYRCELILEGPDQDGSGQPVVIYARDVPSAWQAGGTPNQRASALGLLLKFAGEDPQRALPVFVARRVAWYPDNLLGKLGVDVGLLEEVEDRKRLTARDREAFYQLLAAMGRAKPGQLTRQARGRFNDLDPGRKRTDDQGAEHYNVVPLFNQPEAMRGQLVVLSGTARRVIRIRVEDPDIVERFGIDHYYQLALFTDDSQDNPLIFCVTQLPEGMPIENDPAYGEQISVAGFFLKTWAYHVDDPTTPADAHGGRLQLAPLLIGREPIWHRYDPPSRNTLAGAIAGGLFVVALLGIWLAIWRYNRGDRKFHRETLSKSKTITGPEEVSLDQLEANPNTTPDFSRLEESSGETDRQ